MIEIGKMNTLTVESKGGEGFLLTQEESGEHCFMPHSLAGENIKTNEQVDVFVYLDSNSKRLLATSEIPHAFVGEYGYMEVIDVQPFGAFLDWGINKDLLVPGNEQKEKLRLGEKYLVRVDLEEGAERVFGSTKLGKYIDDTEFDILENDKVELQPVEDTELGYRCIINRKYIGMIYHNETFTHVKLGKFYEGYVKKLREDGLIDASFQVQGVGNLFQSKDKVMEVLNRNKGSVGITDKSSPEAIRGLFGMSKKTFKSAVGMLYKDRKITINKNGIEVVKK
ncbi:MAG: hypothetical protein KC478_08540 [Bacteriovoracaceae bacterium]|nr:hypothetical protein [Bacteriovoracaceae bacterium]